MKLTQVEVRNWLVLTQGERPYLVEPVGDVNTLTGLSNYDESNVLGGASSIFEPALPADPTAGRPE